MLAATMSVAASCNKDNIQYGADGVTPLPEAIDLGMVVDGKNIKWASFNLGASKEYHYGSFYAWGETAKKKDYTEDNYTYADEPEILPAGADAATQKLGGSWRMPTEKEMEALLALENDEDYLWEDFVAYTTEDGSGQTDLWGNVVKGLRITRKATGATLFLPAAGFFFGPDNGPGIGSTAGKKPSAGAGQMGYYWTSSITDVPTSDARYLFFYSQKASITNSSRYFGFTIRPVLAE